MWNVMKAQLYQLKKDRLVIAVFLLVPVLQLTNAFGEVLDVGGMTGSEFVASIGAFPEFLSFLFVGTLVGEVAGRDFMDRTTNYELLMGHTRWEVYLGRAVLALVLGTLGGLLLSAVPVIAVTAVYGWGTKFALGQFLLRFFLMLFPLMRIVSVLILLTILIKNSYVIILLGFFLCSVGQLTELLPPSLILGICNLNLLGSYDSFQIYGFGSYTCTMYDASLPVSVLAATPIVSLLGAAAALIFGGMYFAGDDLR